MMTAQDEHTDQNWTETESMKDHNMNATVPFFRRILRVLRIVVLALVILIAAGYLWASLSTETSLTARGIMWGDSQADDWKRYPSRSVLASDTPVYFDTEETDMFDDFTIENQPLSEYLESSNTTAFIILHDNVLLYEGYFNGSSHEATQASLSVAKSFTSTLVGIAIDDGFIGSLDDPITTYIPELLERDARFGDITLRHLITMSSGLRFVRDESNPFSDDFITYASPDLRAAALDSEIVEAPGIRFHYNDYNPQLLGIILERVTGMSVSEYFESRLWGPMGAEGEGSWDLDSERSGFEKMSVGVNGRAIDFAKLGWLFLHDGKNGERQVVPIAWVEQATRPDRSTHRPDQAYGYSWWVDLDRDGFNAEGDFCQFIYVYRPADLVLVRHGSDCGGVYWTGLLGEMAQAIEAELNLHVMNEE